MSSGESGWNWKTRLRLTSALLIVKNGFSVVAPTRITMPSSTSGKQHVLLGLVEAVDLVDEQQRPLARGRKPVPGLGRASRGVP